RRARRNDARTMAGAYAALYRRLAAHGCGRTVAA
ncbi:MAG: hypothetical protein QOJ63_2140, partial [Solirubrobacteraceae bacterium]|nr:hypothetical protein [Solirubrobacteraceae bacterium]